MTELDLKRDDEAIIGQLRRVNKRFPEAIDFDQFYQAVVTGLVQVFPVGKESVYVCQLYDGYADIIAAAGTMDELIEAEPYVCSWYANHGCKYILLRGRVGWRKRLTAMGWKPTDEPKELRKELGDGTLQQGQ